MTYEEKEAYLISRVQDAYEDLQAVEFYDFYATPDCIREQKQICDREVRRLSYFLETGIDPEDTTDE